MSLFPICTVVALYALYLKQLSALLYCGQRIFESCRHTRNILSSLLCERDGETERYNLKNRQADRTRTSISIGARRAQNWPTICREARHFGTARGRLSRHRSIVQFWHSSSFVRNPLDLPGQPSFFSARKGETFPTLHRRTSLSKRRSCYRDSSHSRQEKTQIVDV